MQPQYHKWYSQNLGREMELQIFGEAGVPVLVFPTSMGKYFEFVDRGMVAALGHKIYNNWAQIWCVDSVDGESWYNKRIHPRHRLERHMAYERYILDEVVPLIKRSNSSPWLTTHGSSFGAYHAMNFALRHPDVVTGSVTFGGAFDISGFLDGYFDEDVYFQNPVSYIPNMGDPWYLERYHRNRYVLVTGENDMCREKNERFSNILTNKGIPHEYQVWGDNTGHDWPWWNRMAPVYLP
jgi:esterase/lipase superfamily enzyme